MSHFFLNSSAGTFPIFSENHRRLLGGAGSLLLIQEGRFYHINEVISKAFILQGAIMSCDLDSANMSAPLCFTSFHLEQNWCFVDTVTEALCNTDWLGGGICLFDSVCPEKASKSNGIFAGSPRLCILYCIHFHRQSARRTQGPPGWHVSVC